MNWKNGRKRIEGFGIAIFFAISALGYSVLAEEPIVPEKVEKTGNSSVEEINVLLIVDGLINAETENVTSYVPHRCETDNLSIEQAIERNEWMKRCLVGNKWRSILTQIQTSSKSGNPQYATFGYIREGDNPNPGYMAPVDRSADCQANQPPEGYAVVSVCVSGCWVPGEKLAFGNSFSDISLSTLESNPTIVTLTPDSTLENMHYQDSLVDAYIESTGEANHEVLEIRLKSGAVLKVTTNHPVLLDAGMMVRADQLKPSDRLISAFGRSEEIESLQSMNHFGKVYNVRLESSDLTQNIVIANGVLNGTSFYQNEGVRFLNLALFRENLPTSLIH